MKSILIYHDRGANSFGVSSLVEALKREGVDQNYSIDLADKQLLRTDGWQKNTQVLIFPGGRDIPYHQALQGGANAHIRNFVMEGGKYFGICAGSYYGSALIEFEMGSDLEVLAERELKFFPGIARGPAYGNGTFCYYSQRGMHVAPLHLDPAFLPFGNSAAYYYGGCAFVDAEKYAGVSILGRYSDIEGLPAAIIQCSVGSGKALLCGVHPEYSADHTLTRRFFSEQHFSALQAIEGQRRQLFAGLLKLLELT